MKIKTTLAWKIKSYCTTLVKQIDYSAKTIEKHVYSSDNLLNIFNLIVLIYTQQEISKNFEQYAWNRVSTSWSYKKSANENERIKYWTD